MPVTRKKPARPSIASAALPQDAPLTAAFTPAPIPAAAPAKRTAAAKTAAPATRRPARTTRAASTTSDRPAAPKRATTGAAGKPASKTRAEAASATPAKAEREAKVRKPKLVRDSFTIPKPEYAVIEALKSRSAQLGRPAKKSEVLRAGIKLLAALDDAALLAALADVPALKTGRPGKG